MLFRSLFPGTGGTYLLPRTVGIAKALEMIWTGDLIDAAEAERIGLVNRVVPKAELETVVRDLAAQIASNAPLTVKAAKVTLRELQKDAARRDTALVEQLVEACFRSEDYGEGQQAFLEKRTPIFRGV